jgi:hypothetical protein
MWMLVCAYVMSPFLFVAWHWSLLCSEQNIDRGKPWCLDNFDWYTAYEESREEPDRMVQPQTMTQVKMNWQHIWFSCCNSQFSSPVVNICSVFRNIVPDAYLCFLIPISHWLLAIYQPYGCFWSRKNKRTCAYYSLWTIFRIFWLVITLSRSLTLTCVSWFLNHIGYWLSIICIGVFRLGKIIEHVLITPFGRFLGFFGWGLPLWTILRIFWLRITLSCYIVLLYQISVWNSVLSTVFSW